MQGRITYLLEQRLNQQLTAAEAEELLAILRQPEHEVLVTDVLSDLALSEPQGAALDPLWLQHNVDAIVALDKQQRSTVQPVHRVHFLKTAWFRYAAAAVVIFALGGGIYYYGSRSQQQPIAAEPATVMPDIAPGGNIATLTLSDGSTIALDTAADGSLVLQGNTDVVKLQKGQLAYKAGGAAAGRILYNTINTPKGGQYQVMLPDGSNVWLNAASSLRFPTAFTGRTREVEITGEAYFEIAPNAKTPFYVRTNGMAIEVLGTKFNVNAYSDEPVIRTTLLEGSVRVRKDQAMTLLAPGQQADLSPQGNIGIRKDADIDAAMAWKNGLFRLTSSDVPTIMRQLARWYDVQVAFEGGLPSGHITGEVPRNTSLSKVLKVFETSGVHFRMEGKKIVVTQ
jgi:transmembrane sensor